MTTERSLASAPKQEHPFDPEAYDDPAHDLTLAIRSLRLGERVRLPNDTLVLSRTVMVGACQQRRFSIIPSVKRSTARERHRMIALGHGAVQTAEEAAKKALEI